MRRLAMFLLLGIIILPWWERVDAATYQITLTPDQEAIIQEEMAYRNQIVPIQTALQRLINRDVKQLGDEQNARAVQDYQLMYRLTTPAARALGDAAVAAGITPPVITAIPDQTSNVKQAVVLPIVVQNDYAGESSVSVRASGLPPGITLGTDVNGAYQLAGNPTTAGTYNVTIEAYNVSQVKATETLVWTVNP